jgi:hypothetical protein
VKLWSLKSVGAETSVPLVLTEVAHQEMEMVVSRLVVGASRACFGRRLILLLLVVVEAPLSM